MLSVTLVAYNRLSYTTQAMSALITAFANAVNKGWNYGLIVISIDIDNTQESKNVVSYLKQAAVMIAQSGLSEVQVLINDPKRGVAENPKRAIDAAFNQFGSMFNVAIEDDAVLTQDALIVAAKFFDMSVKGTRLSGPLLLSLSNHEDRSFEKIDNDYRVIFSNKITSPFAWAITKQNWQLVYPHWNSKKHHPTGWDFSLTYFMRTNSLIGLSCVLSRCKNIGREGGAHETPETFDQTQLGLIYSELEDCPALEWADNGKPIEPNKIDDWMLLEMQHDESEGEKNKWTRRLKD